MTPPQVFISYSRKDKREVLAFAESLRRANVSVWIDQKGILPATLWRKAIVKGIRECKLFILMASQGAFASDNVRRELSIASDARKAILPVYFEELAIPEEFEYQLVDIQRVELYGDNQADALERILGTLDQYEVSRAPDAKINWQPNGVERGLRALVLAALFGVLLFLLNGLTRESLPPAARIVGALLLVSVPFLLRKAQFLRRGGYESAKTSLLYQLKNPTLVSLAILTSLTFAWREYRVAEAAMPDLVIALPNDEPSSESGEGRYAGGEIVLLQIEPVRREIKRAPLTGAATVRFGVREPRAEGEQAVPLLEGELLPPEGNVVEVQIFDSRNVRDRNLAASRQFEMAKLHSRAEVQTDPMLLVRMPREYGASSGTLTVFPRDGAPADAVLEADVKSAASVLFGSATDLEYLVERWNEEPQRSEAWQTDIQLETVDDPDWWKQPELEVRLTSPSGAESAGARHRTTKNRLQDVLLYVH